MILIFLIFFFKFLVILLLFRECRNMAYNYWAKIFPTLNRPWNISDIYKLLLPPVPIYWIAFVFWLFSQKLLIFFLIEISATICGGTNWQCFYWLTESQRDVRVLHLILIFSFPWRLKWKEGNANYNIPWSINKF